MTEASQADVSRVESEVARLIDQLGDINFRRRENARWQLERIGLPAFEQLRDAANFNSDVEIADAAAYIIESQNVVWWLDTDSVEVRSYLIDYSSASDNKREESIQLLGGLDSPDALFALCRLARYEPKEYRSKLAALTILTKLIEEPENKELVRSIRAAMGNGQRAAAQWINAFTNDLLGQSARPDHWAELARAELQNEERSEVVPRGSVALPLCRWIVLWLSQSISQEVAIETMTPYLIAATNGTAFQLQLLCTWALDNELPELPVKIAEEHQEAFTASGELGYLIAEAHLQLGNTGLANEAAILASESLTPPDDLSRRLSRKYGVEGTAYQRHRVARHLERRGMFDWAEKEYKLAIEEKSEGLDTQIRESLATFYWFAGENDKAASVLRPVAEKLKEQRFSNRSIEGLSRNSVLAIYNFYEGLASIDAGKFDEARQYLMESYGLDSGNPDVVIAMKLVADGGEFEQTFQSCFQEMREVFRDIVVEFERALVLSEDRDDRRRNEQSLARACNHLAWLLGKCNEDLEEGIRLGTRAIELLPDTPEYLDSLARCHFSAGNIEKAIEIQREAVRLAPHDRQMALQLKEFDQALFKRM